MKKQYTSVISAFLSLVLIIALVLPNPVMAATIEPAAPSQVTSYLYIVPMCMSHLVALCKFGLRSWEPMTWMK